MSVLALAPPSWDAAAIGGLVCLILGVLFTKGVDALLKLRKSSLEEKKQDGDAAVAGYTTAISDLRSRMTTMELERLQQSKEHQECVRQQGILTGHIQVLEEQNRELAKRIQQLAEQNRMLELKLAQVTALLKEHNIQV